MANTSTRRWIHVALMLLASASLVAQAPAVSQPPHAPAASVTVEIDASRVFQTMEGFGSSVRLFEDPHVTETHDPSTGNSAVVLTRAQEDEILDRLYVDLGLTRLRPVNGRGIEVENDNRSPRDMRRDKFDFSGRRNDGFVEYAKRAAERGARVVFLSPLNEETWMKLDTWGVPEYCEWALAMIRRWRELGIVLPYYSVFNEPTRLIGRDAGEFIREVIRRLGPMLRAEGFETKFIVSDDIGPNEAYAASRVVLEDEKARPYVGALATHLYKGRDLTALAALAREHGLPLWMTEFFTGAMEWAGLVSDLITKYDVSAVDYMWGFFGEWERTGRLVSLRYNGPRAARYDPAEGPVYRGYELEKAYYTFGQFSRFVKPGARRIGSSSPGDPDVKVSALLDRDELVIVAVNLRRTTSRLTFQIRGFVPSTTARAVRTSQRENWVALEPVAVQQESFTADMPAQSVTTFVLTRSGGTGNAAPR